MKRQLLYVLVFAGIPAVCSAQPVLTSANFSPTSGDIVINHQCNYLPDATIGGAGAGVTWDLSALSVFSSDTIFYTECAFVPHCTYFAGTNLASVSRDIDTTFYVSNSARLLVAGALRPGDTTTYTEDNALYHYPLGYGSSFTDTSYDILNATSVTDYHQRTRKIINCDAYGTLILPTGTFNNILRLHVQTYLADSNVMLGYTTLDSTDSYLWCMPGFHSPLLTAIIVSDTSTYFNYATGTFTEAVSLVNVISQTLEVSPNPCYNELNLQFSVATAQNTEINLTDISGKMVAVIAKGIYNMGVHNLIYNIANLPQGLYIVSMHTDNGTVVKKVQIM